MLSKQEGRGYRHHDARGAYIGVSCFPGARIVFVDGRGWLVDIAVWGSRRGVGAVACRRCP